MDGLNLYHGMQSLNLLDYRWLDLRNVCVRLANRARDKAGLDEMAVERVTYCTSFVSDKQAAFRQDVFIQALQAHSDIHVLHGKYEAKGRECECHCGCHNLVAFQKEKRTDVNLAVQMVMDAASVTRPYAALLVTGDTDLVPAIEAAKLRGVKVIVAAPPGRHQEHLNAVADVYLRINKPDLKHSPLPAVVVRPDTDYPLTPPPGWLPPPWS